MTVPDEYVRLNGRKEGIQWRFGSVDLGFNIADGIWRDRTHMLTSQEQDMIGKRATEALNVGPPRRTRRDILKEHPVDALICDMVESETWLPWMIAASGDKRPKVLMVFRDCGQMTREDDIMGKSFRRQMKQWKYDTRYWTIPAWKHGGALDQLQVVTVFCKKEYEVEAMRPPIIDLPPQAMSNLLMPVGAPRRAWTQVRMTGNETSSQGPQQIVGTIGIQPVYADHGVMPDRISSWI
jgi:hypothetical protein